MNLELSIDVLLRVAGSKGQQNEGSPHTARFTGRINLPVHSLEGSTTHLANTLYQPFVGMKFGDSWRAP
jgi:hypothetical protein